MNVVLYFAVGRTTRLASRLGPRKEHAARTTGFVGTGAVVKQILALAVRPSNAAKVRTEYVVPLRTVQSEDLSVLKDAVSKFRRD